MAHDHDHAHVATTNRARLWVAIALIGAFLVVQVIGALFSGSLALLADAGHMASDLIGLVVALVAAMVAARPATDRQTYGYQRAEVIGALVNGVILMVVAVSVAVSAVGRLVTGAEGEAHEVQGVPCSSSPYWGSSPTSRRCSCCAAARRTRSTSAARTSRCSATSSARRS